MFFERQESGTSTLLLSITAKQTSHDEFDLAELRDLAQSAALEVKLHKVIELVSPNPSTYLGSGKTQEIKLDIQALSLQLVVIDQEISPSQHRNLEKEWNTRVITRTELILQLFESRAQTREGKMQVELAMLSHAQSRLVRGWSHLDRQRGGVGLRGAGETQASVDRTLIQRRIRVVRERIHKVRAQRDLQRRQRTRKKIPLVALIGYTNAGKSTLFNVLTQSSVYSDDRLFATLDPTVRTLELPSNDTILLADTVGFIKNLPLELVAAFRATLEEVVQADLLLHVVDITERDQAEIMRSVRQVLAEIGAEAIPSLVVANKIDLVSNRQIDFLNSINVSAIEQVGLDELKNAIVRELRGRRKAYTIELSPNDGRVRALLYSMDAVQNEQYLTDGRALLTVELADEQAREITRKHHALLRV